MMKAYREWPLVFVMPALWQRMGLGSATRTICAIAGAMSAAFAGEISIDFGDSIEAHSLGARGAGQTFYPEDADGYAGETALFLTGLSFWSGNLGGSGSATTYLAVYDDNPDFGTLVGSSTNFIDTSATASLAFYTELHWTFDRLALDPGTKYWAVLSSAAADDNATTIVERSLQEFDHVPAPNDPYRGEAIIADRNPHQSGMELRFVATFDDGAAPTSGSKLEVVGFTAGALVIDASGLDPAKGYSLKRGTDLVSFPDPIGTSVTAVSAFRFQDADPLAGRAFYQLKEETP